jgi:hypothetical protein
MVASHLAMIPSEALGALAVLAERAFAGRVLLAFLPPGLPGRHGPRDLPATWAASHLLGSVALLFEQELLLRLDVNPTSALFLAPWLLLALARWITLPGAMVPRHEPLSDRPSPLARVLLFVSTACVFGSVALRHADFDQGATVSAANALALLALAAFGLAAARRAPVARALCVLALAAALAAAIATDRTEPIALALLLGGGASLAVPWLRRGDRRAVAIAVVAFGGLALLGPRPTLIGAAGLFALRVHTPAPARPGLTFAAVIVLVACAAVGYALPGSPSARFVLAPMGVATLFVVALALSTRRRLALARAQSADAVPAPPRAIDPSRPQAGIVRDIAVLCIVLFATREEFASLTGAVDALLPLAPLVAVGLALLLAPDESPFAASAPARPEPRAAG